MPLVAGTALALWLTRGAWGPGAPAGNDITGHLVRAERGLDLVTHGHLDGWFDGVMVGHREFLFNGPGFTWMLGLLRLSTLGALSTTGALKVAAIGGIVVQPAAVAYLARSFGASRVAAGLAGTASLAASTPFGGGLAGTFELGLVPHQVGLALWCVALGGLARLWSAPSTTRAVGVGALVAVLAATHLISLAVLAVMAPLAFVGLALTGRVGRLGAALRSTALAGVTGAGLGAWWLLPFLSYQQLTGPGVPWPTPPLGERLAELGRGELVFHQVTAAIVIIGGVAVAVDALVARRDRWLAAVAVLPVAYLLVAHRLIASPPGAIEEAVVRLSNRSLTALGVVACIPLAVGVARVAGGRGMVGVLVATAAALAFVVGPGVRGEGHVGEQPRPVASLGAAAARLADLVPASGRFAMARDFPDEIGRLQMREPQRWVAWRSGVPTLNVFNPEVSQAARVGFVADGPREGQAIADWLAELDRLGVTHVLVSEPGLREALDATAGAEAVWSRPELSIHPVHDDDGAPLLSTDQPMRADTTRADDDRYSWTVSVDHPARVTIAVAWAPWWRAAVDGEAVSIIRSADELMFVTVPAGDHRVELTYHPSGTDQAGVAVSLLTIAALGVAVVRRRRDGASAAPPGEPGEAGA